MHAYRLWFACASVTALAGALVACPTPRRGDEPRGATPAAAPADARVDDAAVTPHEATARDASPPDAARAQRDPDGNDDPTEAADATDATGATDRAARPLGEGALVQVGKPPLGWQRICDLRPFGGRLYLAHANQPLGSDGATITTYDPSDAARPFRLAFDWNRFGEPTKGGGGGQGFLRVHAIDGRLFVPDADPPYGGLGALDHGTEGYVFVSDARGAFAPARGPHKALPVRPAPGADGRAGAAVLPRAYHVLDVIKFRGLLYASTGSVPPTARAWAGPSPGALHVASPELDRFTYALGFPSPYPGGVWRLTYLVRFRDAVYAGLQDYDGKSPYDYVVLRPPAGRDLLEKGDARGARITELGAAFTLRWYADGGALYWIAGTRDGDVQLRRTTDGATWTELPLPAELGRPTDVKRFRGQLVVLGERGLATLGPNGDGPARVLTRVVEKKTPFAVDDVFCAAPLGVLGDVLYVGGQRGAVLYRFEEAAPDAGR